jgi:hypothetical protein
LAISWFCWPLAASKTICARWESLTLVSRDWDNFVSAPRSSSVNTISGATRIEIPAINAFRIMAKAQQYVIARVQHYTSA